MQFLFIAKYTEDIMTTITDHTNTSTIGSNRAAETR